MREFITGYNLRAELIKTWRGAVAGLKRGTPGPVLGFDQIAGRMLPIPGLPSYFITEFGVVYRESDRALHQFQLAKASRGTHGYAVVNVRLPDGTKKTQCVHRLVALTFHGAPAAGHLARHLDGNKGNNWVGNIAWGTRKENAEDAIRHGTWLHGERVNTTKLTEVAVRDIRARLALGHTYREIGKDYGVCGEAIGRINRGLNWKHVS